MKINTKEVHAKLDVDSKELYKNNIIDVNVYLSEDIPYINYMEYKDLGIFVIIDKVSLKTVGCGIIKNNIIENSLYASEDGFTIWITGLSGSGKTTLAYKLKNMLSNLSHKIIVLDGDELRNGLNSDLSFSLKDRQENNRRISEMAKLLNTKGYIVICSTISPTENIRENSKRIIGEDKYFGVYLEIDLEECKKRDPKGLYSKNITKFTGVDSPFEKPLNTDLTLDTFNNSENVCTLTLIQKLVEKKYLKEIDF